jgi:1-phosphofructokinase family hexose kinase
MSAVAILIAGPNLSLDNVIEVPSVSMGGVHRSVREDTRGGGKGPNVARALAATGARATVVSLAGGPTGRAAVDLLAGEGLDVVSVNCEGMTRSCLTVLSGGAATVFNGSGPQIDTETWARYEKEVRARLPEGGVLVISGSFPPGAPHDAAQRLVQEAHRRGCFTICDTSRLQLQRALTARPGIVKPNLEEAMGILAGRDEELVEASDPSLQRSARAARALRDEGAQVALVTAGASGAAWVFEGGAKAVRPPRVNVVNPIGAGDCLAAGLACGHVNGRPLEDSVKLAAAMAAASCETFAAGVLDFARAQQLLSEVSIEPLDMGR